MQSHLQNLVALIPVCKTRLIGMYVDKITTLTEIILAIFIIRKFLLVVLCLICIAGVKYFDVLMFLCQITSW